MAFDRMRRALVAAASGLALLALASCGGGTIESQFVPDRLVAFGDAFSDIGQSGNRYTVNDGTTTNWTQIAALNFGLSLTASSAGGLSYAVGNARITAKPDAAGNAATPTVKEQVDAFLVGHTFTAKDLVLIQGGYSDIIAEMAKFNANAQSSAQTLDNIAQAARDLAAQVKRLGAAGAQHVFVVGVYDLGKSPWAGQISQRTLLSQAASRFNQTLVVSLVDEGRYALFGDFALSIDAVVFSPSSYSLTNVTDMSCNSVDPGPGIGIGTNQVNSLLCTPTTVGTGVTYPSYLFADGVYLTPVEHRALGDYTWSKLRSRW